MTFIRRDVAGIVFAGLVALTSAEDFADADESFDDWERLQYGRLHSLIDADKDGKFNAAELIDFSARHGRAHAAHDLHTPMEDLDKDHDNKLTLTEFLEFVAARHPSAALYDVEKAKFSAADKNGDGIAENDELISLLFPRLDPAVYTAAAEAAFRHRDLNGDGSLNLVETFELDLGSMGGKPPPSLQAEFSAADGDGDSRLCFEEFVRFHSGQQATEDKLRDFVETLDQDGDGFVTAAELDARRREPELAGDEALNTLSQWLFEIDALASSPAPGFYSSDSERVAADAGNSGGSGATKHAEL